MCLQFSMFFRNQMRISLVFLNSDKIYLYIYLFSATIQYYLTRKATANRRTAVRETGVSLGSMGAQLKAPWTPSDRHNTIVVEVLGEALNWAPLVSRTAILTYVRCCSSIQAWTGWTRLETDWSISLLLLSVRNPYFFNSNRLKY